MNLFRRKNLENSQTFYQKTLKNSQKIERKNLKTLKLGKNIWQTPCITMRCDHFRTNILNSLYFAIAKKHLVNNSFLYIRKRKIRAEALTVWKGNTIPTFKNNVENTGKLKALIKNKLVPYQFLEIGFGESEIKAYIINMFAQ